MVAPLLRSHKRAPESYKDLRCFDIGSCISVTNAAAPRDALVKVPKNCDSRTCC